MKNLLLSFILLFSFSINAQYAVMSAVDLNDGAEEDYLKLEKFCENYEKMYFNGGREDSLSKWYLKYCD